MASGHLTPAEVVQIAYLISILAFPVRALGWVLGELPRAVVGWERVSAVLEAKGEMAYGERGIPQEGPSAAHLIGVDYLYDVVDEQGHLSQHQAIRGVTIEVRPARRRLWSGPPARASRR